KLCKLGIPADLIEVDARHDFHLAWMNINLTWSPMWPDGRSIIFRHNYFNVQGVDLCAHLKGLWGARWAALNLQED
ncbi:hypothetical protein SELMODRAFT_114548, partial [Selaginella moellendorffii]